MKKEEVFHQMAQVRSKLDRMLDDPLCSASELLAASEELDWLLVHYYEIIQYGEEDTQN